MTDNNFQEQPKLRHAELIKPPNVLKEKVGSGGLSNTILNKAQTLLEENTVDFIPIAKTLINAIDVAAGQIRKGTLKGEAAIEAMIYPAMQLKAQGSMFQYPLVTELSNILVNFLETVSNTDNDVLELVDAHRMAISAVVMGGIKGDGGKTGEELREELMGACNRYYQSRKAGY